MTVRRTIALYLDGYEESLERRFAQDGLLPNLTRLKATSARFLLDHGAAQRTGLAGEHVSTGRSPEAAARWSAVDFDTETYELWQEGTRQAPFPSALRARTVVFDMPYFDLGRAPDARGIVSWGAHDPGVAAGARPVELLAELERRVGAYPAHEWIYGIVWASAERTRAMGESLARACDARTRAVLWLLGERLPDWDLALVTASEPHSAIEGLWHGVDPAHPLHHLPSAAPAREGLVDVYRATDRMVGALADAFPDANVVVFATGGMGPNRSDVASMLLLPELAYRHRFGRPLFRPPAAWTAGPAIGQALDENDDWQSAVQRCIPTRSKAAAIGDRLRRLADSRWPRRSTPGSSAHSALRLSLDWMPAMRYQPYWWRMPFFALPSFYDGRVRVNLKGRERHGRVPADGYRAACDEIERLVRACRDPLTGEDVVDFVEHPGERDPYALGPSASDLVVVWKGVHCVFDHPTLGRLGPAPWRRPGGHTGPHGVAYLRCAHMAAGDYGVRSSFDVVPTLCELLGEPVPATVSGRSLLAGSRRASGAS